MSDYPEHFEVLKFPIGFTDRCSMTTKVIIGPSVVIKNDLADSSNGNERSFFEKVVLAGNIGAVSIRSVGLPVHNFDSLADNLADHVRLGIRPAAANCRSHVPVDRNVFCISESSSNFPDQSLTGQVFTHSSSSSLVADGESGDSVAADPRNDATPDTSVKGVRDDA